MNEMKEKKSIFLFSRRSLGFRDAECKHGKPNTYTGFSLLFLACLTAGAILKELEVNFLVLALTGWSNNAMKFETVEVHRKPQ